MNRIDYKKINSAGKSLKYIAYTIIGLLLVSTFILIGLLNVTDKEELQNYYMIFAMIGLIGNIVIIILLYSAGQNLEKVIDENDETIEDNNKSNKKLNIRQLTMLKERGIITEQEFELKKKEI